MPDVKLINPNLPGVTYTCTDEAVPNWVASGWEPAPPEPETEEDEGTPETAGEAGETADTPAEQE